MIVTQAIKAKQPKSLLDELNMESGRIYTETMVTHWRNLRQSNHWTSQFGAMKLNDYFNAGVDSLLHSHSIDAAQEAFYKACKTIKALRNAGDTTARYPHRRKRFRTTVWKNTGIRVKDGVLLLSRAKGLEPVRVSLPKQFRNHDKSDFVEVRLVFNHKRRNYKWHLVIDDGIVSAFLDCTETIAIDLGEIHPAVASSQTQAVVFSARELRSTFQLRNKKQAEIRKLQAKCEKKSLRWWRLQRAWNKIQRQCDRKIRDICHKVSRAVVEFALESDASTIVIGDVKNIADKTKVEKRLGRKSRQKMSNWPHGTIRKYIEYKAAQFGIAVELEDERYTSQTCPSCQERTKQRNRNYKCKHCGWVGHRDAVGAMNILSKNLFGNPGEILVTDVTYRQPFKVSRLRSGSCPDTGQDEGSLRPVAVVEDWSQYVQLALPLEAAPL